MRHVKDNPAPEASRRARRIEGIERVLSRAIEIDHDDRRVRTVGEVDRASRSEGTSGALGRRLEARNAKKVRVDDEDGRLLLHIGKLNPG